MLAALKRRWRRKKDNDACLHACRERERDSYTHTHPTPTHHKILPSDHEEEMLQFNHIIKRASEEEEKR